MAVRVGAGIFVATEVLDRAGVLPEADQEAEPGETDEETTERLAKIRDWVNELNLRPRRRFRLTGWMKRVLDSGHLERMNQWVSARLQEYEFIRVDPDARAKAAAAARAKADAMWDYFKRVGEAAAYGRAPPPTSELFRL